MASVWMSPNWFVTLQTACCWSARVSWTSHNCTKVACKSWNPTWNCMWPTCHCSCMAKTTRSVQWHWAPVLSLAQLETIADGKGFDRNWFKASSSGCLAFLGFSNNTWSGKRSGSSSLVISSGRIWAKRWRSKLLVFWSFVAK